MGYREFIRIRLKMNAINIIPIGINEPDMETRISSWYLIAWDSVDIWILPMMVGRLND